MSAAGERHRYGLAPYAIEPGRNVMDDWEAALFETWPQRKARLALGRAAQEARPTASTHQPEARRA